MIHRDDIVSALQEFARISPDVRSTIAFDQQWLGLGCEPNAVADLVRIIADQPEDPRANIAQAFAVGLILGRQTRTGAVL